MSSGKIEQNFFMDFQDGLLFNESVINSEDVLYKSYLSRLKPCKEGTHKDFYSKKRNSLEDILNNHFDMIQKIDVILKYSQDLTQKQKYEYCNSQRFFMKLYLKNISEKI